MYGNPYYAPYQYPMYAPTNDFKGQISQPIQNIPQQPQMPQSAVIAPQNDMIWVLNENEADAYPVAPNRTVTLWDKSRQTIYLKSMSANGVPSKRILDFTERTEMPLKQPATDVSADKDKYVTVEQFDALRGDFDDLRTMCDKLAKKQEEKTKTSDKKNASEGE